MTIKLPVQASGRFIQDADGEDLFFAVDLPSPIRPSPEESFARAAEAAALMNATATDLTALINAGRATLDWLGPVEKSPPLLPGYGLSEGGRLVAERNVLRGILAAALNATATPAPDLTQLREAVEAMQGATPGTLAFQAALDDTMDALDALFPEKDGTP